MFVRFGQITKWNQLGQIQNRRIIGRTRRKNPIERWKEEIIGRKIRLEENHRRLNRRLRLSQERQRCRMGWGIGPTRQSSIRHRKSQGNHLGIPCRLFLIKERTRRLQHWIPRLGFSTLRSIIQRKQLQEKILELHLQIVGTNFRCCPNLGRQWCHRKNHRIMWRITQQNRWIQRYRKSWLWKLGCWLRCPQRKRNQQIERNCCPNRKPPNGNQYFG